MDGIILDVSERHAMSCHRQILKGCFVFFRLKDVLVQTLMQHILGL